MGEIAIFQGIALRINLQGRGLMNFLKDTFAINYSEFAMVPMKVKCGVLTLMDRIPMIIQVCNSQYSRRNYK